MANGVNKAIGRLDESTTSTGYFDGTGSRLFTPDLLTPAQYYSSPPPTPYHRLLLAVLEDAIRCFQRNLSAKRGPRRALFREVKEWLFDTNDASFMSFQVICESLGIEPALLRRQLREWQLKAARGLDAPVLPRRTPISADKSIKASGA